MSQGINKAILVGRVTQEPDIRAAANGTPVANFNLVTNYKYQNEEKPTFHRIVAFGKLADIVQRFIGKGKQLYVEGRIDHREWQDKDGNKRTSQEIIAYQIEMLGARVATDENIGNQAQAKPQGNTANHQPPSDDGIDDIPF